MKRKLLTAFLLTTAFNAFAIPIESGRILKHSEFTATNTKISFKQSDSQSIKNLLQKKYSIKSGIELQEFIQAISTLADIEVGGGPIGDTLIQGTSKNGLGIMNNSSDIKKYSISHNICVAPQGSSPIDCSGSLDIVEVDSGSIYVDRVIPVLSLKFPHPGIYEAYISTTVTSEDGVRRIESMDVEEVIVNA